MSPPIRANVKRFAPADFGISERGIALILVLWLTVFLTVIASSFAYSMRGAALAARNGVSQAQARALADGAVHLTLLELIRPGGGGVERWRANGVPRSWEEDGAKITAVATDESAKIDINTGAEPLLRGLLQTAGAMPQEEITPLVQAIQDWRDRDDLRRPNGAEEPEYRAAGRKYKPANMSFDAVAELQRVLGMTPQIYARIADSLTVYSRAIGINPAFASRTVLLAIPGVSEEQVDEFLVARQRAIKEKTAMPLFATGAQFGAAPTQVWRIHVDVAMSDGVVFSRETVLRPTDDPRQPPVTFLWQESRPLPPPADDPATSESTPSLKAPISGIRLK